MSSPEPIVSIITPTFNHERYIKRCIDSAIGQTDPRWEQIVVDDGSDDSTGRIVRSIGDPRIRYVRRAHRGIMHLAESYNLALEIASGSFIAVLEGDDFLPEDKIERQLGQFADPDVVLGWGATGLTDETGQLLRTSPKDSLIAKWQNRAPGAVIRGLLEYNFIPAVTVMCRRDALISIGGFQQPDGLLTTDYPTWLELCRVGRFAASTEVLGFHRIHPNQVSVRNKDAMDLVLYWGIRFVERLSDKERRDLGLSLTEARRIERQRRAYLDYWAGRVGLREHDSRTRAWFRRALRDGSGATKLKAGVGLSGSYLGLDLERIVTMAERIRRS